MDECLEILAQRKECPTDAILVQQVRLQLIIEKATQIPRSDVLSIDVVKPPPAFYLKALKIQLQEVRNQIVVESQANGRPHYA